jgi:Spy/CpxP family protein refolding chaperone
MRPSPRLWIASFVALVFLIGAVTGVFVDRLWLLADRGPAGPPFGMSPAAGRGPGIGRGGPDLQSTERVVSDLDERLTLTSEQEAAIRDVLERWRPRVQELQNATRQQFIDVQRQLRAEIGATLTPEQLQRFQQIGVGPLEGGRGPRGGMMDPGRGPRGRGR